MSTTGNISKARRINFRGAWWVTVLFSAFGVYAVFVLLNLIIAGRCESKCVIDTLSQTLRLATPIALAALTGLMCERSGIVNIGIEGQMLMAAMVGYAVNLFSYQFLKESMNPAIAGDISRWLAVLAGVVSTMILGWILAVVSIKYKTDQIIGGTVINMLALGVTGYLYRQFLAENLPPGPGTFPIISIPGLSQIPFIGQILFTQKPLTFIMLLLVVFIQYMLFLHALGTACSCRR